MIRKMKCVPILLLTVLLSVGCAKNPVTITNLPTAVTQTQVQNWTNAVNQLQIISDAADTATTTVIGLNKSGVFKDGPAYVATLKSLGHIVQLEISANNILQATPQQFGKSTSSQVAGIMQQIMVEIGSLNSVGAFSSLGSANAQQITTLISSISTAANLVIALGGL